MNSNSIHDNKDLFNSLSQKQRSSANVNDLNELMLKYVLDLNLKQPGDCAVSPTTANRSSFSFKTDQPAEQTTRVRPAVQDTNNNLTSADLTRIVCINTAPLNLANADIDFFCDLNSGQKNDDWAKFDNKFSPQQTYKENENYFEVWHKFFITLKAVYEHIYAIFSSQQALNSLVFGHEKIQHYISCLDETYVVYKRVLISSNKYVNKKQSHLDNNLKHEIERLYSSLNKVIARRTNHHDSSQWGRLASSHDELSCALCLHTLDLLDNVELDAKFYHANCINMWLNLIDESTLPNLKLNCAPRST